MAQRTPETLPESRKVEVRLFVGIGLAVFGGLLLALLMMGDAIKHGVDTINTAYAYEQPSSCGPGEAPVSAQGVTAAMASPSSRGDERVRAEEDPTSAAPAWLAEAGTPRTRRSTHAGRGAKRVPTYIRRPAPEPDAAPPELTLRRSL